MGKIKCDYCGSYVDVTEESCPYCGAINQNYKRNYTSAPDTIAELQEWYKSQNLPDASITRFFIGVNCLEPCCFGIYQDEEKFIVYKNKVHGERSIRYEGTDEAYAVNELYLRLKSEILNQKERRNKRN